ncbi:hypothetical protein GE115_08315 [Agromyces sp. CFH 90414]|uniref:DUF4232 domain-containing protein n=1 Tax=Agromyces agglutinans TaxID=2662258 RepID=A0A6I2F6E4_9MICO|nr:hypothetical protein [Agromyces agglutinans]MRG59871.1 hypothetical protein [Agromyces agglutinans]
MRSTAAKAAAAMIAAPIALCGCASEPSSQNIVTVGYSEAGATTSAVLEVDGIRCAMVGDQALLGSTEPHEGTQAQFTASSRPGPGTFTTGASLGEDLWFLSDAPFDLVDDGAVFDDIPGTVARGDSITSATEVVDAAATLSADIRCTTGELE